MKGAVYYHLLFNLMRRDEEVAKSFINAFMTEMMPELKQKKGPYPEMTNLALI